MVGPEHQGLVELLRKHPDLVAFLLNLLSAPVPPYARVDVADGDLTEALPLEFRVDGVLVFRDEAGKAVLAVVIEVQRQIDDDKEYSWPAYAMVTRARERCPVEVFVVTVESEVAEWAASAIRVDSRNSFTPLVLGPAQIPRVTDPEQAQRDPFLAILSALAHPEDLAVLETTVKMLRAAWQVTDSADALVGKEIALYYTALIWTRLGDAVRPSMERWMREHPVDDQLELPPMFTHWRDDARDEAVAASLAAGVTEGQAKSVLMFLEARALLPTDAERERILACREVTTLERWIKRAVNVAAVAELFADG